MANTLNLGNGNWATKEDSLLAYNSENGNFKPLAFNFTRASSATVVNKAGLIETVGSGEPRIDFLGNTKGALKLEPQRTNLYSYSEDFSNAAWTKSSSAVTITPNVAPDGTTNSVYNLTGTNANLYTGGTTNIEHTISVYAKSNGQGKDNFKLRLGNNTSSSITVTDEWVRYQFTATPTTTVFGLTVDSSPNNEWDILIWGAQLEQGSYATSYIPTQGSAVTRILDSCIQTVPEGIVNENEMTLYCELEYIGGTNIIAMSVHNNSNSVIWLNIEADLTVSGANFYGGFYGVSRSTTSLELNNKYKIAYRTKNGDSALYINGILEASSTETIANPNILNKVQLGGFWTNANTEGNFKIIDAKCYNSGLSNAELQALTTI